MGDSGLLNLEMLHSAGQRLLILIPACLKVIYELEIDPTCYPVPVQVMDNNILLHNALVVIAPCDEGHILTAPLAQLLKGVGKGYAVGKTLFVKAGYLLYLVMHAPKIYGLDIDGKLLAGAHVFIQLYGADLYYLPAEMYGKLVKYGGLGTHRLVPFQIHHYIIHSKIPFSQI